MDRVLFPSSSLGFLSCPPQGFRVIRFKGVFPDDLPYYHIWVAPSFVLPSTEFKGRRLLQNASLTTVFSATGVPEAGPLLEM